MSTHGEHPAVWEKKGANLFTVRNVTRYRELRVSTNRLLNKIEKLGGFVFYVGIKKTAAPAEHDPNQLYKSVLVEAISPFKVHVTRTSEAPPQTNKHVG